jgi:hypothetical protein
MKHNEKTNKDAESARPANTAGLMARAKWLCPKLGWHHLHNGYARFRKEVVLEAVPRRAMACLTVDRFYRFTVDGKIVCHGRFGVIRFSGLIAKSTLPVPP